jgi:hypothetical protein
MGGAWTAQKRSPIFGRGPCAANRRIVEPKRITTHLRARLRLGFLQSHSERSSGIFYLGESTVGAVRIDDYKYRSTH